MVWVRDEVTRFMACLAGWLEEYGSGLGGCVRLWSLFFPDHASSGLGEKV
jgi:hypothetical protein